jgi:hypothetical protein
LERGAQHIDIGLCSIPNASEKAYGIILDERQSSSWTFLTFSSLL